MSLYKAPLEHPVNACVCAYTCQQRTRESLRVRASVRSIHTVEYRVDRCTPALADTLACPGSSERIEGRSECRRPLARSRARSRAIDRYLGVGSRAKAVGRLEGRDDVARRSLAQGVLDLSAACISDQEHRGRSRRWGSRSRRRC